MPGRFLTAAVSPLRWGDAGTLDTLEIMAGLAHAGADDPTIRREADDVGLGAGGAALRRYLLERVRFDPDPPGELIRSPAQMLADIQARGWAQGDCDDLATYGAALTLAHGLPTWYHLVGWDPDGPMSHVWTVARLPSGELVELDTLRDVQGLPLAAPARWEAVRI